MRLPRDDSARRARYSRPIGVVEQSIEKAAIEPPAAGEHARVVVVDARRGGLSRQALAELWAFREVLWAFTVRFVKIKYKQAAIGIGWVVLQPLISAAIFTLFLGRYAKVPSDGAPYLVFALAGLTGWTYFSTAISTGAQSVVENQNLLKKVYFPREVLPLSAVGAGLVDLGPALVTLIAIVLAYGIDPAASWILLPLPILILVLAAAAVSLGLGALNVYYRDVRHALPFIVQVGLFASAVVYPLSILPSPWGTVWGIVNPVAGAITALREIVVHGAWPDAAVTFGALGWSLVLLAVAYAGFKRFERSFSDRV
jgi:lipopolysaccharide transport system permease protein